eukprot:13963507-Alexandrium_andersonii.AAC.1
MQMRLVGEGRRGRRPARALVSAGPEMNHAGCCVAEFACKLLVIQMVLRATRASVVARNRVGQRGS